MANGPGGTGADRTGAAGAGTTAAAELFAGPGEVRAVGRTLDWGATPLGWPDTWSPALRIATRAVLDAPHPVCLWAGPRYALVYNDAYRRILAAKHPAALGQPGSVVWAEIWEQLAAQFAQVWDGGPPVYGEDARFVMARLEGGGTEDAWFSYSLSALREEDGTIVAVLNISPETTARVRAEQALGAERERLRGVILQAPVPMALHEGPEHRYVLVNAAYQRVSGGRDVTGLTLREAFPEVAGQGLFELFDRVYATGESWAGPETHLHYDRLGTGPEDAWFHLRYDPVRDGEGSVTGILNFSLDVTDQVLARREVERLLAESERARADADAARRAAEAASADAEVARLATDAERRRLAVILDQLPVGVVVVDATAAVVHLNPASDTVLGTSLKPVAGLDDYPVHGGGLHPDGRPYAAEDYPIARALLHGEVVSHELTRYRRGDGRVAMLSISAAPVRDADGRITYAVATIEDVSQLEAARAEAQAANRAKSEFLAVMSHELRTPLNAIGGYAELLEMGLRGPVTGQQREDLGRIQRSQRHLLGLVNEVLNYAKLETGTVRYDMADVVVREAITEAEALVAPQARAKGLVLGGGGCAADLVVRADPEKLRQVLVNLLSNAVKFTERRDGAPGRITVACAADGDRVRIAVGDTGIGIAADKLDAVFEPFVQVRADLTRTAQGTGLGLAISRDLARGMGGELTAESTPGLGSTFTLTLSRACPARA